MQLAIVNYNLKVNNAMPYIIETWDKLDHQQQRQQRRAAHLKYLDHNMDLLLACGAKLDDDGQDLGGGIYIINTEDKQIATAFIQQDPFYLGGLFEKVAITRWRKAYFNAECCL